MVETSALPTSHQDADLVGMGPETLCSVDPVLKVLTQESHGKRAQGAEWHVVGTLSICTEVCVTVGSVTPG